jgi:hypothetical protein
MPGNPVRSGPDLAMKGRNAGEDVGNYRYLGGPAGKPGAIAGFVVAGVPDERRAGADLGTHLGQHRRDVAADIPRQLIQFHLPKGWMVTLPHLGLHEPDITFVGPDGDEAESAGASETIEFLRSGPALMEHDIPVVIAPSVVRDDHLPRGGVPAVRAQGTVGDGLAWLSESENAATRWGSCVSSPRAGPTSWPTSRASWRALARASLTSRWRGRQLACARAAEADPEAIPADDHVENRSIYPDTHGASWP